MERYLALLWPAGELMPKRVEAASQAASSLGLTRIAERRGLIVFGDGIRHARLGDDRGVVVGDLFSRNDVAGRVESLPEGWICAADEDVVRLLLRHFWGRYVAFLEVGGELVVLRDPSAAMPCYQGGEGSWSFVASDLAAPFSLGLMTGEIDWSFLSHLLAYDRRRSYRTGIVDVREILPGTAWSRKGGTRLAWDLRDLLSSGRRFRSLDTAQRELRTEVERCVTQLASPFQRVSLSVSGGLDSSIVAGCAGAGTAAINYRNTDPESDERGYAHAVARAFGLDLEDHADTIEGFDLATTPARWLPRPGRHGVFQKLDAAFEEHARRNACEAFMGGTGGDSVFYYSRTAAPAADRLKVEGVSLGVLSTIRDVAALNETTFWTAASAGWRIHRRPNRDRFARPNLEFLVDAPSTPDPHPWIDAAQSAPPGRLRHVEGLVSIHGFLDGHRRSRLGPILCPLLAQPVMEVALRIPSWMWVAGGRDRAVARLAFSDRLPSQVVNRRSKGGVDRFVADLFERYRQDLRRDLVGGRLAAHAVIDDCAIASFLDGPADVRGAPYQRLLTLMDLEAWARSWEVR